MATTSLESAAAGRPLQGPFAARVLRVIDGDTLVAEARLWEGKLTRIRVRIAGIDAPEIGHHARCAEEARAGEAARTFLSALLAGHRVELREVRRDKYRRALAHVTAGDVSVAGRMVAAQHARSYFGAKRSGWCD